MRITIAFDPSGALLIATSHEELSKVKCFGSDVGGGGVYQLFKQLFTLRND